MSTKEKSKDPGGFIKKVRALPEKAKRDVEEHYEKYLRLIQKMAHKYKRNRVEYDDLVQEALFGLVLACRDFDPKRSTDFHTYAIYRMKGKMYEYCIGNENPIYVPTHVAKAASYVKQMQRLLDREPQFLDNQALITDIIAIQVHELEEGLNPLTLRDLRELKRKLGNIANNSNKMTYASLAKRALESLSLVVSDDILSKFPKENEIVEEIVSNRQLSEQLRESLGEKRFTVLSMRALGYSLREIAEHLELMGYTNRQGNRVTRQAVMGILNETLQAVSRMRLVKNFK